MVTGIDLIFLIVIFKIFPMLLSVLKLFLYEKKVMKKYVYNLFTVISFGAIHKGCLHIRRGGRSGKSGKMLTGGGRV